MKQKLAITATLTLFAVLCLAQIKVSDNQKFLSTKDGKPFFWLGDTDWELFHRLTREEAEEFINIRSAQGFNVLQAVALAEFNGVREPNRYGDVPLNNEDPTQLLITPGNNPANAYEYDYWDHVDFVVSKAAEKGMYIGLLPTWGDKVTKNWGEGPAIFDVKNAEVYGSILAKRYVNQWNILWVLGGDRPAVYKGKDNLEQNDIPTWRAMAKGIEGVLGKEAFITYHPSGGKYRTTNYIHQEAWLDMNAFQSGHGSRETEPWNWVKEDLAFRPQKPTLDMEPCYEDHPVNPWDGKWSPSRGYFHAYDVRARIYRGVFAGACGVTYGHHQIWQFLNKDIYPVINVGDTIIGWKESTRAEAAGQMQYLRNLMLSRPYYSRVADQSIIKSESGNNYIDLVYGICDENKSYAMVYLPQNKPVKIDLSKISGPSKNVWWFDPRSGTSIKAKSVSGSGTRSFTPPKEGQDWVLVIDDASKKYNEPGK